MIRNYVLAGDAWLTLPPADFSITTANGQVSLYYHGQQVWNVFLHRGDQYQTEPISLDDGLIVRLQITRSHNDTYNAWIARYTGRGIEHYWVRTEIET